MGNISAYLNLVRAMLVAREPDRDYRNPYM